MAAPEIDSADGIEVGGILLKDGAIKDMCVGTPTELTISSGSVTVAHSYHTIDTENDDASDDLVTIAGGTTGKIVIIRPVDTLRTIVVKNGSSANQISCGTDFTMGHYRDNMVIMFDSDLGLWFQLSRSDNGT